MTVLVAARRAAAGIHIAAMIERAGPRVADRQIECMEQDCDRGHAGQGHDDEHEDAMNASTVIHGVSRHRTVVVICKARFGRGLPWRRSSSLTYVQCVE